MRAHHRGFLSPKLLFVLIFALGVMGLLLYLSRSTTFTTVEVNLSHSQQIRAENLKEAGALERKELVDGRNVLNVFQLDDQQNIKADKCAEKFVADLPSETRYYENRAAKMSFEFPYNSNWGNSTYYIYPFDEKDNVVYFGPIFNKNCFWQRAYKLQIHPRRSVSDLFAEVAEKYPNNIPDIIKIKNKEVLTYIALDNNSCKYPVYYLLGPDFDYEFSTICSGNLENDQAFLGQIIETVKYLP
jgi:hypothetical protein